MITLTRCGLWSLGSVTWIALPPAHRCRRTLTHAPARTPRSLRLMMGVGR